MIINNGCVYFALLVNTFVIKIGYSEHPGTRACGIRWMARNYFGIDPALEYLALVKGPYELETYYHHKFAHLRLANEWFLADPELIKYAQSQPYVDVSEFYKWKV
jgi:hypothetical protein